MSSVRWNKDEILQMRPGNGIVIVIKKCLLGEFKYTWNKEEMLHIRTGNVKM